MPLPMCYWCFPHSQLASCPSLAHLGALDQCLALTSVDAHGCCNLSNVRGLSACASLAVLDLSFCHK